MNKPEIDVLCGAGIDYAHVNELAESLEKTTAQNPKDLRSLLLLGNAYYLQGKISKAIEVFNRAIKFYPKDPYAYYYIGIAQYRSAHIQEAVDALTQVTVLDPSMVMVYYWLGITLFHCGRYDEARKAYETLLQKNNESHIAHYHASVICMFQRDYTAACKHLEALVRLGSQDPQVYLRLGNSYFQLHKLSESMNAYRTGLQFHPDNAPLKNALTEIVEAQDP